MPLVTINFSELVDDSFSNSKEALNLILGPPGEGAFAACPGHPTTNRPGNAKFYPNTVDGRNRYLRDSRQWEEAGRNNFFSSVVWDQSALTLPDQQAPLTIGGSIRPLKFGCLWCDVDKGTTELTKELLLELTRQSCILSYSGGKTVAGKNRFHIRLLLDDPITDLEEFYRLNRWFAAAMGGEKFAPVSWLTLPGSMRFKQEYPGGKAVTQIKTARGGNRWRLKYLRQAFKLYAPEPTGGAPANEASDLVPQEPQGGVPKLPIEIRRMLRQKDAGDGTSRYKQTNKLVKLCAEHDLTKENTLWVLEQHEPSVSKFGFRLPSQIHACWPEPKVEVEESPFEEEGSLLAGAVSGDWLDKQTFPPLVWSVPEMIPEGLGMIVAPPKAGKSWWATDVGLACSAGGKALGRIPVDQRPVLYLALEDSHRRLQERYRKVMEGAPVPKLISSLINCEPNIVIPTVLEFLLLNSKKGPLVIIDTLQKARGNTKGKNDDSYAADYDFGSQLKNAVDQVPGSSLLLVHHTKKAESDDFVNSISGTQGLAGSMDFILALQRKRNSNDAVLHLTGRDVEENTFALKFQAGRWILDGDTLADAAAALEYRSESLGDRSKSILQLVSNRKITDANTTTASDVVLALGVSSAQASVYLKRLFDKGLIGKRARGEYVPLEA